MARIDLNRKFSNYLYSWTHWIFDHIKFHRNDKILEIGCGNAILWKANIDRINPSAQIILSDSSEGMLNDAKNVLGEAAERFDYMVMDAQNIIYPSDKFDIGIANLMLYHVPDRQKTISEIARVLNDEGIFYATTFGKNNMKELTKLLSDYDSNLHNPLKSLNGAFGLENGEKQLNEFFADVEMIKYVDSLEITETEPLIRYILSFTRIKTYLNGTMLTEFKEYINHILDKEGKIKITKDTGIFIAKNPK